MCKDGTYWTGGTKSGACKGHQGIKDWYAPTPAVAARRRPAPRLAAAPAPAPATPAAAPEAKLQRLRLLRLRLRLHRRPCIDVEIFDQDRGARGWPGTGLAEYFEQCVSLLWRRRLRHDQGRSVYVRGRREGQRRARADHGKACSEVDWQGIQGPVFRAQWFRDRVSAPP